MYINIYVYIVSSNFNINGRMQVHDSQGRHLGLLGRAVAPFNTSGAPIMPRDVSFSGSKCRNGGHEWVKVGLARKALSHPIFVGCLKMN